MAILDHMGKESSFLNPEMQSFPFPTQGRSHALFLNVHHDPSTASPQNATIPFPTNPLPSLFFHFIFMYLYLIFCAFIFFFFNFLWIFLFFPKNLEFFPKVEKWAAFEVNTCYRRIDAPVTSGITRGGGILGLGSSLYTVNRPLSFMIHKSHHNAT